MTQEQREKYNRTPIDVVFIRSCKAKIDDDSKVKDFAAGQEAKVIHRFADELVSLGKATEKGSIKHEQWIADEKKKSESKKTLAPSQVSTAEALLKLADAVTKQSELIAEALGGKKSK